MNIGLNFLMVFFAPSRAANSLPSTSNLIAICLCCDSLSKSSRVTLGILQAKLFPLMVVCTFVPLVR